VLAVKVRLFPEQIVSDGRLKIVGVAGGFGSDNTNGPTAVEVQPFNASVTLAYVAADKFVIVTAPDVFAFKVAV
jgi:hypothetical protein